MAERKSFHQRVSAKIREIREKCGETMEGLAKSSGLSENALKLIESGSRDIKISELFRISRALNVRISLFLGPCDFQFYTRRKEEDIKCHVFLKNLSLILGISDSKIRGLCMTGEIPHSQINGRYFFFAPDVNDWLRHHLSARKRLKEKQISRTRIFGMGPMLSVNETVEIFGCSPSLVRRLIWDISYYRIGKSIRLRPSDLENYMSRNRIKPLNITTRIGTWKSPAFCAEPSTGERMTREASFRRSYSEYGRLGY